MQVKERIERFEDRFFELEEYLSKLTGEKADLVSKKALKPYIG